LKDKFIHVLKGINEHEKSIILGNRQWTQSMYCTQTVLQKEGVCKPRTVPASTMFTYVGAVPLMKQYGTSLLY
jgi:hypothetical protein